LLSLGEGNSTIKKITFAQLNEQVRRYRAALKHVGVTVNDRVVGMETVSLFFVFTRKRSFEILVYLPNCPEALIICLAAASLGAIFSAASADFGVLVRSIEITFILKNMSVYLLGCHRTF